MSNARRVSVGDSVTIRADLVVAEGTKPKMITGRVKEIQNDFFDPDKYLFDLEVSTGKKKRIMLDIKPEQVIAWN